MTKTEEPTHEEPTSDAPDEPQAAPSMNDLIRTAARNPRRFRFTSPPKEKETDNG